MEKRDLILQAALKLFVQYGFHGTPTSKIASEAGVSNGTLFHYFSTKDELVVALYVHIKSNLAGCFSFDNRLNETFKATFKRMYLQWMAWGLENPLEFRFVWQFVSSPYRTMVTDETIQEHNKRLMTMMQEAMDARIFKSMPADLIMNLIQYHLFGMIEYLMSANPDKEAQKELMELSYDMVWDMIT